MAQDTAHRLTFCYGGHDWNVTGRGGQEVNGWSGDTRLLRTHGDKPHRGSSLSLFMEPPAAAGLKSQSYIDNKRKNMCNLLG